MNETAYQDLREIDALRLPGKVVKEVIRRPNLQKQVCQRQHTVTSPAGYKFFQDLGVVNVQIFASMVFVHPGGEPFAGQYTQIDGTYIFHADEPARKLAISYAVQMPRDVAEDVIARAHRKALDGRRQLRSVMRGMFAGLLPQDVPQ